MKTKHAKYEESFEEVTGRPGKNTKKLAVWTLAFLCCGYSQAQSPGGQWMTFDERTGSPLSIVQIVKNNDLNTYEGIIDSVIVASHLVEGGLCTRCQGSMKNQPVVGLEILNGYICSTQQWRNGKILDPETGDVYSSKIWFSNPDEIKVRGYGGPFELFFRTQKWRRITGEGIQGVWEVIDDRFDLPRAHVRLVVMDGELKGTIVKVIPLPHEGNYPICLECEGDEKNQPIVGLRIMNGYRQNGDRWSGGEVLDPGNGTVYSSSFWLKDEDTLIIRGYWGPFFRTQEWKRFESTTATSENENVHLNESQ